MARARGRALHRIAHWLGRNKGNPETFWTGDRLYVGFRCTGCGGLSHVEECGTVLDMIVEREVASRATGKRGGGR